MMEKIYLGVDIGGTAVKFGIVSDSGEIFKKAEFSVSFDGYETPILQTVLKRSEDFINSSEYEISQIAGIGVSATGQIDVESGMVVGSAGHIKNWVGTKIKEGFEKKYGVNTVVINDANSAALGEKWIGAGRSAKDIVAITIGTGVGGGIIVDEHILLGRRGLAGEIGHIIIHGDGEECSCKNRGCLERYASMTALIRRVGEAQKQSPKLFPASFSENINGRVIFEALKENTKLKEIVDSWMDDISKGLVSMIHIFNPELIIIGGGVSAQRVFIEGVKSRIIDNIMPRFAQDLKILPAALGNDAGLIGAVYYLISNT